MPRHFEGNLAQPLPEENVQSDALEQHSSGVVRRTDLEGKPKTKKASQKFAFLPPEELEVIKENPIDLTDEAEEADSADAFAELQAGDVRKGLEKTKKKQDALRALSELGGIDKKKKGLTEAISEKARIEEQHAREMAALEEEAAAVEAAAKEEHAEDMAFLNSAEGRRSVQEGIRASMAEELEAIRNERNGNEAELDMTENGEVKGLKNLTHVSLDSFRRAFPARMNAIRVETFQLLKQPSNIQRDSRLKALGVESGKWMQMYQVEKLMKRSDAEEKENLLHNLLFKQIDLVVPEGLTQSDAETLAITPEQELDRRMEVFKKQDVIITTLLDRASKTLWDIEETDEAKAFHQREALAEFLRGAEEFRRSRKEEAKREIDFLESLDQPDKLDVRGQKLNMLMAQAQEKITYLRNALGKTTDVESVTSGKEAIDDLEQKISDYQKDLEEWHAHPIRQEAMDARHTDLQERIRDLQMKEEWNEMFTTIHVPEADTRGRIKEKSVKERMEDAKALKGAYLERVHAAKNAIIHLAREKAENAEMQAAIISERVDRELETLEITVDLSDLNPPEEPEGVDVDVEVGPVEFAKPSKIESPKPGRIKKAA
jgi:hypothetical protein